MFAIFPIALPAILVVVAAAVLVRRERADQVIDLTEWDDVPLVPVSDVRPVRASRACSIGGALIEPDGASLGARMRAVARPAASPAGGGRIRRRDQPLVASRADD